MAIDISKFKDAWIVREEERLTEKRKYPHFDPIVGLDEKRKSLLFDPKAVKGHSFFPLIKSAKEERRRKFNKDANKRLFNRKERPICYAAHIDSLIFSWYGYQLNELYTVLLKQKGINDSVLAYRALNKSTPEHVANVGSFIKTKTNCAVLCFDITGFFESIPHKQLKNNWLLVIEMIDNLPIKLLPDDHFAVFKTVTSYSSVELEKIQKMFPNGRIPNANGLYLPKSSFINFVIEKHKELKTANGLPLLIKNAESFGIPQGLPISGVLANISMLDFDIKMHTIAVKNNGMYRRYSDDILLVVDTGCVAAVEKEMREALSELNLKPNEHKRELKIFSRNKEGSLECKNETGFDSHLQYLGIEFDGRSYFLRSQSVSRFYRNIKRTVGRMSVALTKRGAKVFRYRNLYRKFTGLGAKENIRNFLTYADLAHQTLLPFSKINIQVNSEKIKKIIKIQVKKKPPL
jgi:RNA-directed DNA polymerase